MLKQIQDTVPGLVQGSSKFRERSVKVKIFGFRRQPVGHFGHRGQFVEEFVEVCIFAGGRGIGAMVEQLVQCCFSLFGGGHGRRGVTVAANVLERGCRGVMRGRQLTNGPGCFGEWAG